MDQVQKLFAVGWQHVVEVEADVAVGVPGGLTAQATLELFQDDLLEYIQGKRHGGEVLCISTVTCMNGSVERVMGF